MLQVEIPLPTPSLNQLQRMHFHAVRRLRDQYVRIFRTRATSVTRAKPAQFRRVTIERRGLRELDYDNLVGGCKPLIDALARAGLIWDDSARYIHVDYKQTKASARHCSTLVTIA